MSSNAAKEGQLLRLVASNEELQDNLILIKKRCHDLDTLDLSSCSFQVKRIVAQYLRSTTRCSLPIFSEMDFSLSRSNNPPGNKYEVIITFDAPL